MKRSAYEHVLADAVPAGLRFDVLPATAGKPIEVCYGGDAAAPAPHTEGAPFKRVRNLETKEPATFFRLAADQTEDLAYRARQVADARARNKDSGLHKIQEANASEPPARWARHWRADGWLCAFIDGMVILVPKTPHGVPQMARGRTMEIAQGKWAYAIDIDSPPWKKLDAIRYADRVRKIARDCYCNSFPRTGCDFCNGTRLPDGAQEIR